jgi:hypothetical protein
LTLLAAWLRVYGGGELCRKWEERPEGGGRRVGVSLEEKGGGAGTGVKRRVTNLWTGRPGCSGCHREPVQAVHRENRNMHLEQGHPRLLEQRPCLLVALCSAFYLFICFLASFISKPFPW